MLYRTMRVFKWNSKENFLNFMKDLSLFLFVSAFCRYHYAELLNTLKQLIKYIHIYGYVCCEFVASFLFFLLHKCVLSAAGKCLCYCYMFAVAEAFET
jgi:hypothetical protein